MIELTDAEIDELEAGPQLNILIARHVFGLDVYRQKESALPGRFTFVERWGEGEDDWAETAGPDYSGTWQGAGLVWEAMVGDKRLHEEGDGTFVAIFGGISYGPYTDFVSDHSVYDAPTPFVAICRAALKVAQWQSYRAALQTLSDKLP